MIYSLDEGHLRHLIPLMEAVMKNDHPTLGLGTALSGLANQLVQEQHSSGGWPRDMAGKHGKYEFRLPQFNDGAMASPLDFLRVYATFADVNSGGVLDALANGWAFVVRTINSQRRPGVPPCVNFAGISVNHRPTEPAGVIDIQATAEIVRCMRRVLADDLLPDDLAAKVADKEAKLTGFVQRCKGKTADCPGTGDWPRYVIDEPGDITPWWWRGKPEGYAWRGNWGADL